MKTIQNKTTEIKNGDKFLTYADMIKIVSESSDQQGISVPEMRSRLQIIDIAEKAKDTIEFEDAMFAKVLSLSESMKWGVMHKDIVSFQDELEKAK